MKCDACGTESDFDAGFVRQPAAVGRRAKNVCPACWVKRTNVRLAWYLPSMTIGTAFGYAADQISPAGSAPGRLLMYVCGTALFTVFTIIPHELGHAVVARALGWRVYQMVIGVGKSVFKRRWLGTLFDMRMLPLAGATLTVPRDIRWFRLKMFLMV